MYTLGIPLKQKRRTLGYLSNEYFPGGMKKLGQQVPYEIISTDRNGGFFVIGFPNMDHYEYSDIVLKLKQQGVTVIGADSQLTENKTMKLKDLVPLKEYGGGHANYSKREVDLDKMSEKEKINLWARLSDDEKEEALLTIIKDPSEAAEYIESDWTDLPNQKNFMQGIKDYVDNTPSGQMARHMDQQQRLGKFDEGSCGYGEGGKIGSKPSGQESDLKKLRAFVRETVKETFQDNPDVQGITGMEDSVNDPKAKAEKILNQLTKAFPDIPLERVVNDSTYKSQAITQILFGMMD